MGVQHATFPCQATAANLVFVCASVVGLWSGVTIAVAGNGTPLPTDTARNLVVSGPYRYVRNPMALTGLAQGACMAARFGSWFTLVYVLAGAVLWNWGIRPIEEADLQSRFGESFKRYGQEVRCWVPRFPGYDPADMN